MKHAALERVAVPPPAADRFLLPGEYYFGDAHARVATLLGSCVAVVLWHPRWHLGGMCHFLVPHRARTQPGAGANAASAKSGDALDGRFGDEAIALLAAAVAARGTRAGEYQVHVYGGAAVFDPASAAASIDIGKRNIECALRECAAHGFAAPDQHTGGGVYRRIALTMVDGAVALALGPAPGPAAVKDMSGGRR